MAVRLDPVDDFTHAPGDDPRFNESMYFNFYDRAARVGGFVRLGNRVNEGRAEMTVCVYLPDGRVGFMFKRPAITTNDAFDGGGLRFEVLRPLEELRVTYSGHVVVLDDPLQMADPAKAFKANPAAACTLDLTFTAQAAPFGGEPEESRERPGEEFAKAHYEQLMEASGSVTVGDASFAVAGHGLRDHSWGPRSWQAPWYYRWLVGAGPDFGFMGSQVVSRDGRVSQGGFILDGGDVHLVRSCDVDTTWQGDDLYHRGLTLTLHGRERDWVITGRVENLIPLRNRRDEQVTRISEGLTEWTLADGRVAHGLSEYLDQIVDGRPVGCSEG